MFVSRRQVSSKMWKVLLVLLRMVMSGLRLVMRI